MRVMALVAEVVASVALAADVSLRADPAAPTPPAAAEPAFEAIGSRQGLSSSSVYALMVDRHGFLWLAGNNGVHRYDGQHVDTIDRDPDRPDALVSRTNGALAETADAIWILSFNGVLQRLDARSGAVTAYALTRADERSAGRGRHLVVDRAGRLWVATDIGLFRFDPERRRHEHVALADLGAPRITALATSADGRRLYVGTVAGDVVSLDPDAPARIEPLARLDQGVPLVFAPHGSVLWLGTTQGLFRLDPAMRRLDRGGVPDTVAHERVEALVAGRDGTLWFGSEHRTGLDRFDPATRVHTTYRHHADDPHGLASDRVTALALDARDNLWIGLQRDGAHRMRTSQRGVGRYRAGDGRSSSFCAMHELPDGRLATALCGGSVGLLDPASGTYEHRGAELDAALAYPSPTLTSHVLVPDGRGGLWLPTAGKGLLHWDPARAEARYVRIVAADGSTLPDPYMNHALVDDHGRLWVACSLGLASLAPGDDVLRLGDPAELPGRLLSGGVLAIERVDDVLWLGTTQGLVRYEPDTGRTTRALHAADDRASLSDNLVAAIRADRDALWVGTQAGLNRAMRDATGRLRFRRYGVADGLPDQTIDAIVVAADGALWVGTNRGLATLDVERDRFRAFGPDDGVPDSPVNWRAGLAAADGSLYVGTFAGLVRIVPGALEPAAPQTPMLSAYELGGTSTINLGGSAVPALTTPYTEARVRFRVAAFGDHRRLAYRLDGLETVWRSLPPGLVVGYDPLPPGRYRFDVRQQDPDGAWLPAAFSIPLTVAPPPWRSAGAYALYALVLTAALAVVLASLRRRRREARAHLDALRRLATCDPLTELPNRTAFGESLAALLADPAHGALALLFIDLDRFKNINDSLGHRFGDRVLVAAAARLRAALPAGAEVARLGGDEFTVVVPKLRHEREAALLAEELLAAFATPLRVEGSDVVVTLSIGIALAPAHADDPATLTQYADSAMYYAKAGGRNAYRVFSADMVAAVSRRLALETSLRHALERGELYPVFQPEIDASGEITTVEVLLRWQSAEHGAVAPIEFIPILEDSGMIEPVGLWLIDTVCEQMRRWRERGLAPLRVAVNVSPHQLMRGELAERLGELLAAGVVPRDALELEVTESAMMENAQRMGAALGELRVLGLTLAIDDFGVGYSSFASLSHLPVDKLKIDKAFVDGVGRTEAADTLCAAIIAMAHNLKLAVVAEGVETELQHRRLVAMGCDALQGYWHCRPLPAAELEQFLRQHAAQRPRTA